MSDSGFDCRLAKTRLRLSLRRGGPYLLLALLGWVLLLLAARPAQAMDGLFGSDLQIDGGILDFVKENGAVVIRNYATLNYGGIKVHARNMVYYYEKKEIYAEGDVVFDQPDGNVLGCDRLFFNLLDWRGTAENIRGTARQKVTKESDPEAAVSLLSSGRKVSPYGNNRDKNGKMGMPNRMVIAADRLQAISRDHQEAIHVGVTPSLFAQPHWQIASAAVNIRRKEKIESWHNVLKIGRVPVFYFPYIIKDLKYDWPWLRVGGGHSKDWGVYGLTRLGIDLDPDPENMFRPDKLFFDLDYRQNRGWANGVEFDYLNGKDPRYSGDGAVGFYFTEETNISKSDDRERAYEDNDTAGYQNQPGWTPDLYRNEQRWAADWYHVQEFSPRFSLKMESHTYSDRDFQREYDEYGFKEGRDPITSFDLTYNADNWNTSLVAEKRTNDWLTMPEYLPEWRFNVPGLRLGQTKLYLNSVNTLGFVNKRFDTAFDKYGVLPTDATAQQLKDYSEWLRTEGGDDYDGGFLRAHTRQIVSLPFNLGPVTLVPYAGGRATYYGETYRPGEGEGDGDLNAAFEYGATLATRFFGRFAGDTLLHAIEPTIKLEAMEDPTVDPNRIYKVDDIDYYPAGASHLLKFNLNQKLLQKGADGKTRERISANLGFDYYYLESEAEQYRNGQNMGDITFDLVARPSDDLVLFGDVRYNRYESQVQEYGLGGQYSWWDNRFFTYVSHRFTRAGSVNSTEDYDIDQTTFGIGGPLWNDQSKYSLILSMVYQWAENPNVINGIVEEKITLRRDLDTFWIDFSFARDEQKDDTGFFVHLVPKGWVGLDRESSANTASEREISSRYSNPSLGLNYWDEPFKTAATESDSRYDADGKEVVPAPATTPTEPGKPAPETFIPESPAL